MRRATQRHQHRTSWECGCRDHSEPETLGDGWSSKRTLFNWQSMRPHAELHQQPQPGNGHWNLKLWHGFQLTRAQKPSKVSAELGPLVGSCSWGDMHITPNLSELTLHVCLKPEEVPEDENGEAMPRRLYCLTMPPAQLPHEGCCWASAMLSPRTSRMRANQQNVHTLAPLEGVDPGEACKPCQTS